MVKEELSVLVLERVEGGPADILRDPTERLEARLSILLRWVTAWEKEEPVRGGG